MIDWVQVSISFVLGMMAGEFLRFVRVRRGGHSILRPSFERPVFDKRWLTVVLVAMFVVSTAQVTWWTFHQRQCNSEFQSTTLELRRIAAEDRQLEKQSDDLQDERDNAMTDLVEALLAPPLPSAPRVDSRALLTAYRAEIGGIDVRRADLHAKRADLERQRQAQTRPEQRCR